MFGQLRDNFLSRKHFPLKDKIIMHRNCATNNISDASQEHNL